MRCPGQDMQYWNEEAIYEVNCPECGKAVEFYKDDTTRSCSHCGHRFVNPKMDFGCAAYCQFAEQCLGTLPEEFVIGQDSLLKDKVAVEVKRHLGSDFASIRLAAKVAYYADRIGKTTAEVNMAEILCSAYLLPAGLAAISGPEEKTDCDNIDAFRQESLAAAREVLNKVGASEELHRAVARILTLVASDAVDNADAATRVVNDAYTLALLEKRLKGNMSAEEKWRYYRQSVGRLVTDAGRGEAETAAPASSH